MKKKRKDPEYVQACRVCGCTDDNCIQCVQKTSKPCFWVENDLCSACMKRLPKKEEYKSMNEVPQSIQDACLKFVNRLITTYSDVDDLLDEYFGYEEVWDTLSRDMTIGCESNIDEIDIAVRTFLGKEVENE